MCSSELFRLMRPELFASTAGVSRKLETKVFVRLDEEKPLIIHEIAVVIHIQMIHKSNPVHRSPSQRRQYSSFEHQAGQEERRSIS